MPIEIEARGPMAGVALYASLFDKPVGSLRLQDAPTDHQNGPHLLNINEILDLPQVFAIARDRTQIVLEGDRSIRNWSNQLPLQP